MSGAPLHNEYMALQQRLAYQEQLVQHQAAQLQRFNEWSHQVQTSQQASSEDLRRAHERQMQVDSYNQILLSERASYSSALSECASTTKHRSKEITEALNTIDASIEEIACSHTATTQDKPPKAVWKQSISAAIEVIQLYVKMTKPSWWAQLFWFAQKQEKKQHQIVLELKKDLLSFQNKPSSIAALSQWLSRVEERLNNPLNFPDMQLSSGIVISLKEQLWIVPNPASSFQKMMKKIGEGVKIASQAMQTVRDRIHLTVQGVESLKTDLTKKIEKSQLFFQPSTEGRTLVPTPVRTAPPPPYETLTNSHQGSPTVWYSGLSSQSGAHFHNHMNHPSYVELGRSEIIH